MKLLLDTHAFIWWDRDTEIVSRDPIFQRYDCQLLW
jgi:PIN domain nuclease of toxin-antitoxin system